VIELISLSCYRIFYAIEHFSNARAVLSGVQGGFFFRKKPPCIQSSLYSNLEKGSNGLRMAAGTAFLPFRKPGPGPGQKPETQFPWSRFFSFTEGAARFVILRKSNASWLPERDRLPPAAMKMRICTGELFRIGSGFAAYSAHSIEVRDFEQEKSLDLPPGGCDGRRGLGWLW
jgi:hypothetical protein